VQTYKVKLPNDAEPGERCKSVLIKNRKDGKVQMKMAIKRHEDNVRDKIRSRVYDIRIKNYEKLTGVSS
jgi:hypothetical protein